MEENVVHDFRKDIVISGRVTSLGQGLAGIEVDVNGDKKPNPTYTYRNEENGEIETRTTNINTDATRPSDAFYVLITEDRAIPYGAAAQRVLYNNEE